MAEVNVIEKELIENEVSL